MKNSLFIAAITILLLSSFGIKPEEVYPKTISKNISIEHGNKLEKTIIILDGNTSREDLIQTCNFLAKENVQLTFEKLSIGKSFLGVLGKSRIRLAKGKIQLSNGSSQTFKVGGITNFKSLKIQYSRNLTTQSSQVEMIEKID